MQEQDEARKQQLEMRLEIQKEGVVAAALAGEPHLSHHTCRNAASLHLRNLP